MAKVHSQGISRKTNTREFNSPIDPLFEGNEKKVLKSSEKGEEDQKELNPFESANEQ